MLETIKQSIVISAVKIWIAKITDKCCISKCHRSHLGCQDRRLSERIIRNAKKSIRQIKMIILCDLSPERKEEMPGLPQKDRNYLSQQQSTRQYCRSLTTQHPHPKHWEQKKPLEMRRRRRISSSTCSLEISACVFWTFERDSVRISILRPRSVSAEAIWAWTAGRES